MKQRRRIPRAAGIAASSVIALAALGYIWQNAGVTGPDLPLRLVADVPLTGSASRFDYASMDPDRPILWLAHMGDGSIEAFDTTTNRVTLTVPIAPHASVRGILAARGNVYAAAQGLGAVVVVRGRTGTRLATVPAGDVDGLAFDPRTNRVFVSDESGGRDLVIDAATNRAIGSVALGGQAGNTQYDPTSHHIFVGVQNRNELAEIDPVALRVLRRYPLRGCLWAHSVAIDATSRAAYVGCQTNAQVIRLDLRSGRVTGFGGVGIGIDVLALDDGLHRLYVGSESGIVSMYDVAGDRFDRIAQGFVALHAHVVAVDPIAHRVYLPLENVAGKPVMRVMEPR